MMALIELAFIRAGYASSPDVQVHLWKGQRNSNKLVNGLASLNPLQYVWSDHSLKTMFRVIHGFETSRQNSV